ncbi:MAG: YbgF trimerization domain-containing protein [Pseudomonadales bacterium]
MKAILHGATGLILCMTTAAYAAVPVEERSESIAPAVTDGLYDAEAPRGDADYEALGSLNYQLQLLQREVQELRGMVEEQAHRLERMAQDQKEQYLLIDRELAQLRAGEATLEVRDEITQAPVGTDERTAYANAFNLTRDKHFPQAIDAYHAMLADYPSGQYSANALYWLGEIYLVVEPPDLERSRQSFVQVVNLYPRHQKASDSMYKLAVVYRQLGDLSRAREYLDRVQSDYGGTSAARLAASLERQMDR